VAVVSSLLELTLLESADAAITAWVPACRRSSLLQKDRDVAPLTARIPRSRARKADPACFPQARRSKKKHHERDADLAGRVSASRSPGGRKADCSSGQPFEVDPGRHEKSTPPPAPSSMSAARCRPGSTEIGQVAKSRPRARASKGMTESTLWSSTARKNDHPPATFGNIGCGNPAEAPTARAPPGMLGRRQYRSQSRFRPREARPAPEGPPALRYSAPESVWREGVAGHG